MLKLSGCLVRVLPILSFLWVFIACPVYAGIPPVTISRDSKSKIAELKFGWPKFLKSPPELKLKGAKYSVFLAGSYTRANWILYTGNQKVRLVGKGRFILRIPIVDRLTELKFRAVGPSGEAEHETLSIYVVDWDRVLAGRVYERPEFDVVPSFGVSYFTYRQTDQTDFNEVNLVGKIQTQYNFLPPHWSLMASFSGSLFVVTSNSAVSNMRLLNFDLVTGYTFYVGRTFSASIMPGMHYKTSFVTDNVFGYFNMAGPQLYIPLSYQFRGGDMVNGYFKFGPIVRGGRLLTLNNFEYEFGLGPVIALQEGHLMPIMVEASVLNLSLDDKTANAFNVMLTLGYSL